MANTKIYRKGGFIIIDQEGLSKFHFDVVDFDFIAGKLVVTEKKSGRNNNIVKIAYKEIQNEAGSFIGNYDAVETYIAELKILPVTTSTTSKATGILAFDVPMGYIPGVKGVNKFGGNKDITAGTEEDVNNQGGEYPYPARNTAPITNFHQEADEADLRGETLEFHGLDIDGYEVVQTKDLDATDSSVLVTLDTPLYRIFRAKVLSEFKVAEAVHVTNSGDTVTYAIMGIGHNQTLMAQYTTPIDAVALITNYYGTVVPAANKSPTSTRFSLWMADRLNGYTFQLKHMLGVPKEGPGDGHPFNPYGKIPSLVDIKITALPLGEDADVAAGFDLYIIRE